MNGSGPIYVDFDDVLCETAQGLAGIATRCFGWVGTFNDIHSFDLGASFGLEQERLEALLDMAHEPETLLGFDPMPGVGEGMRALADARDGVAVVTGRPPSTREASEEWLRRHDLPYKELIFVDKYGRDTTVGGYGKAVSLPALASMDFCLAIDDAPTMLAFLIDRMAVPTVVFERPWNARFLGDRRCAGAQPTSCSSWADIRRHVLSMSDA